MHISLFRENAFSRERHEKFVKGQNASRHAETIRASLRMHMILLPEGFTSHVVTYLKGSNSTNDFTEMRVNIYKLRAIFRDRVCEIIVFPRAEMTFLFPFSSVTRSFIMSHIKCTISLDIATRKRPNLNAVPDKSNIAGETLSQVYEHFRLHSRSRCRGPRNVFMTIVKKKLCKRSRFHLSSNKVTAWTLDIY